MKTTDSIPIVRENIRPTYTAYCPIVQSPLHAAFTKYASEILDTSLYCDISGWMEKHWESNIILVVTCTTQDPWQRPAQTMFSFDAEEVGEAEDRELWLGLLRVKTFDAQFDILDFIGGPSGE